MPCGRKVRSALNPERVFHVGDGKSMVALLAAAQSWFTKMPASVLFWSAYVLRRPLGATLGDTLTKLYAEGGPHLTRITSSFTIEAIIVVGIIMMSRSIRPHSDPFTPA